jgi:hypothetical protein
MFVIKNNPAMLGVAILATLLVSVAVLGALHVLPNTVKRAVTVFITFVAGAIYVVDFLTPPNPASGKNFLAPAVELLGKYAQVVIGFTILLGIYNLCRIHFHRLIRARAGWGYSIVFFISFLAMLAAGFWRGWPEWFAPKYVPPALIKAPGPGGLDLYTVLFNGLLRNLDATMFSILAFYIVSAAYRAFRIRSLEAGILMITAVILMLGQVPLGQALTAWIPRDSTLAALRVENLSGWLLGTVNASTQRAIGLGLGLGQLAMALRIWLSLERGTYFGGQE